MAATIPLNIFRYVTIIQVIKNSEYISAVELFERVQQILVDRGFDAGFSKRTLQRDLHSIREYLDISISFSKSSKGYYIPKDEKSDVILESLLEHINLLCALRSIESVSSFVFVENRDFQGMEYIYPLVKAIKNSLIVSFDYQKFTDKVKMRRNVEPYALREFNGRWYLLSTESKNEVSGKSSIKTWGLDRISDLSISEKKFVKQSIDIKQEFDSCFGIYSDKDKEIEGVILSFNPLGGRYNVSKPLHKSQEVLIDNEKEFRVKLKVKITYDFIMELLSQSERLTIIAPKHLKETLLDIHQRVINRLSGNIDY